MVRAPMNAGKQARGAGIICKTDELLRVVQEKSDERVSSSGSIGTVSRWKSWMARRSCISLVSGSPEEISNGTLRCIHLAGFEGPGGLLVRSTWQSEEMVGAARPPNSYCSAADHTSRPTGGSILSVVCGSSSDRLPT